MRWLVRIVGGIAVAAVILLVGVLLLPKDRITRIVADQIEAHTGRSLQISGDVSMTLWPVLGVKTGPVRLGNAEWAGTDPMLTADALEIAVALPELIRREIRITRIHATRPVLRVRTRADGRGNWQFGAKTNAGATVQQTAERPQPDADGPPVSLELLDLKAATLIYMAADREPVTLTNADLVLRWPDRAATAEFSAVLRPAGQPVEIAAGISQPQAFFTGAVVPVAVELAAPGGRASFEGQGSLAGEATGRLSLKAGDTVTLMAALGLSQSTLPQGLGRAVNLEADVTYTADGRLSLRQMTAELDQNRITGAADIVATGVPKITARLGAGVLQIGGNSGGEGRGAGGGAPETARAGWSTAPIDASALGLADADIRLSAQGLRTPDLKLGPIQVRLTIERSRAVLKLQQVSVFQGVISGRLVANNRKGFSVGGKLAARDIEILAAQRDLLGLERIKGKAAGELQFLGAGNSADAIMRSLSGSGALRMGRGVILGFDLDQLMRRGTGRGGTTVFDSLTASWTMRGGNLQNDDLLLRLKNFKADGVGRIGLGARDIDYLFTPVALRANSGQGVSIPIRIKGPWAAPRILPDLEAAAKARADVELKALEAGAKAKLQEKLERELDVRVAPGQDATELLKDSLEDKARSQLFKLLGQD